MSVAIWFDCVVSLEPTKDWNFTFKTVYYGTAWNSQKIVLWSEYWHISHKNYTVAVLFSAPSWLLVITLKFLYLPKLAKCSMNMRKVWAHCENFEYVLLEECYQSHIEFQGSHVSFRWFPNFGDHTNLLHSIFFISYSVFTVKYVYFVTRMCCCFLYWAQKMCMRLACC